MDAARSVTCRSGIVTLLLAAVSGASYAVDGWLPFDCDPLRRPASADDGQHASELRLIPHPNPRRPKQFLENFRDWELRRSLSPDWQWVRHLPLIRNRYLASEYGRDLQDGLAGELDVTLDWVENWTPSRCRTEYVHERYAVVRLVEPEGRRVRTEVGFYEDGVWANAGRPERSLESLSEVLERFRKQLGMRFDEPPDFVLLVTLDSNLCRGIHAPCQAAKVGGRVVVAGSAADALYFLDPTQPVVTEERVRLVSPVANLDGSGYRKLIPVDSEGSTSPQ